MRRLKMKYNLITFVSNVVEYNNFRYKHNFIVSVKC